MSAFIPVLAYILLFAYLPLAYVTARTVSREKLRNATFVRTVSKDYLRTLPICALVSLPVLALPSTTPYYAATLHLLFAIPLLLEMGHIYFFKTRVGLNTFYSLFVSNVRETKEYVEQNVSRAQRLLVAVVWLLPPVALWFLPIPHWSSRAAQAIGCAAAVLAALPLFVDLCKRPERRKDAYYMNPFTNLICNYIRFKTQYRALRERITRHAAPPFQGITSRISPNEPETYVVVIGESANAMHHHYCGYARETNEFTDALGDAMLRFKGVRSQYAQTIPSLEKTITFADDAHPDLVWTKGSVIDYFHDAGFETYWLSNQYALDDTALTALAARADISRCYNYGGMKRFEKAGLDEGLLPDFRRFIRGGSGKKILFLHLIGSHSAYVNRYPDAFRHFRGQPPGRELPEAKLQYLNAYDDSIRYTDWLVAKLVEELGQLGGASYLMYFSDHGEDIYDSTDERILGHSQLANEPMTSVPLMLWTSPRLDELRPDVRSRFRHARTPYALEDLIHTIIDVSSLSSADYEDAKSILA